MKTVTIDFTGAKKSVTLHEIIKTSFQSSIEGFPDFYGMNADALWDCLTGFIETPVTIILKGTTNTAKPIETYMQTLIEVFKQVENEKRLGIKVEIID